MIPILISTSGKWWSLLDENQKKRYVQNFPDSKEAQEHIKELRKSQENKNIVVKVPLSFAVNRIWNNLTEKQREFFATGQQKAGSSFRKKAAFLIKKHGSLDTLKDTDYYFAINVLQEKDINDIVKEEIPDRVWVYAIDENTNSSKR